MADNDGGGAGDNAGMVPSARLREETAAKREALARVGELEAQVKDLEKRGATVETLTSQVNDLKSQIERDRSTWAEERAVYQAGITDPEAIDVARHLHARLPEKDRPAFADWLKSAKEDPTKAPKALSAYFQGSADKGAALAGATRTMGAERETSTTGASAGGEMSVEQATARIEQLAAEAQRTRDWTKYNAERPALLARITKR